MTTNTPRDQASGMSKPTASAGGAATAAPRRCLIVDDAEHDRIHLQRLLRDDVHLEIHCAADGTEALEILRKNHFSLVITDLNMPPMGGLELIEEIQRLGLPVSVIVTTGYGSIDVAVRTMRAGAYDFLTKPFQIEQLRLVMQRALRERELQDQVNSLREQLQNRYAFHNVLSKNPRMHEIFALVSNLAHTTTTVLIEGETGTGKEQLARAVHQTSLQRNGPLVAVNCAALPENLLDSELFGHERGAFTSAMYQRIGRFEMANGGTLFLDEIGDVPAAMQAKLLRVLQERCFERVGGSATIYVDVRVIAATNRPLKDLVKQGVFRQDLYYRLNVVKIELPPLRERLEDIPLLSLHFSQKYTREGETTKRVSPEAMALLLNHSWPGNIRELENAIQRACVTTLDNVIRVEHLPPYLSRPAPPQDPLPIRLDQPLPDVLREATARVEKRYICEALQKTQGDVGRSARICGISRRSMSAKIAEYGIDKMSFKLS